MIIINLTYIYKIIYENDLHFVFDYRYKLFV
jgi:hypothetical protein